MITNQLLQDFQELLKTLLAVMQLKYLITEIKKFNFI